MRLVFDLRSTQPSGKFLFNGGSEYVKTVFKELTAGQGGKFEIYSTYDSRLPIDSKIAELCEKNNVELLDISKNSIAFYIEKLNVNRVFIGVVQDFPRLKVPDDVEIIFVCHDVRNLEIIPSYTDMVLLSSFKNGKDALYSIIKLIFFKPYQWLRRKKLLRSYRNVAQLALRPNTQMITVSEHSKYAFKSLFPSIDSKKIRVLWSPAVEQTNSESRPKAILSDNFLLMLSADRWEKNARVILRSLKKINLSEKQSIELVIVGSLDKTILKENIKRYPWLQMLGYVERREIEWLLKNCQALIFPSLSEGFGYPPVEAMAYGKPVLASASSSIVEVCGSAPIYFNPTNDIEIEARLRKYLESDQKELSEASTARFKEINEKQVQDLKTLISLVTEEWIDPNKDSHRK